MASTFGITTIGAKPFLVEVEADLLPGMPDIKVIGLPDTTLREFKEKIRSAISNSGFLLPPRKIVIHMMPPSLPKTGAGLELAAMAAILHWQGKVSLSTIKRTVFFGGVSLSGKVMPANGILAVAHWSLKNNFYIIIPAKQLSEISWIKGLKVLGIENLIELTSLKSLDGFSQQKGYEPSYIQAKETNITHIIGQPTLKRALALAASGRHHMLFAGPPGSGKTMAATAIQSILPRPELSEWMEIASIHSLDSNLQGNQCFRPFRAPHHSASHVALIGGGSPPGPGEVTKANYGVLFLDELLEFSPSSIGALREPLSEGKIVISRARQSISLSAKFQLIGAFNPCPCGNLFSTFDLCNCYQASVFQKLSRLDSPFLDRIDLQLIIEPENDTIEHPLSWWQDQVKETESRQRIRNPSNKVNGWLNNNEVREIIKIVSKNNKVSETLTKYISEYRLSGRAEARISRLSLTIMDWEKGSTLLPRHIEEAIHFQMISHWLTNYNKKSLRQKVG